VVDECLLVQETEGLRADGHHRHELERACVLGSEEAAGDAVSDADAERQAEAYAYLRTQGITDVGALAAYGIGAVNDATLAALRPGKRRLAASGALWPTRNPRDPDRILGVVRLAPAQQKHGFATQPVGLGCTAGITDAPRILLCDTPLTAMELH
jgi:hypothetical protein